jgi:enoyl-CoA hydratase/carnithine racemase
MAEGTLVDFETAHGWGLVTRVLEAEGFEAQVLEYARTFCPPGRASLSVGLIKRAVCSGADGSLADGLALERELQQRLFQSDDAREGIAAHVERRTPAFTGR